jgi:LysM repeat protein
MNRDKEVEAALKRPPTEEPIDDESLDDQDPVQHVRPARARTSADLLRPPTVQRLPPLKVQPPGQARRGPSYPAWEKPPTQYDYPRLRGRDDQRTVRPLLLVAGLVAVIVVLIVAFQALAGRGGTSAAVSSSPSHAASLSPGLIAGGSGQPSASAVAPSPTATPGTPRPVGTFQKYQVVAGDSVAKVATKFHLQKWELLLANPQIVNNVLKLGSIIYIPLPGQLTPSPAAGGASSGDQPSASVVAP